MASVNGVMGEDQLFDLPEPGLAEQDLSEEKAAARFSKTREFKKIRAHLERRIDYYQSFLPDGTPVIGSDASYAELGARWMSANIIIGEFRSVINEYEQAAQVVKDAAV